jgi:hypothetical protein
MFIDVLSERHASRAAPIEILCAQGVRLVTHLLTPIHFPYSAAIAWSQASQRLLPKSGYWHWQQGILRYPQQWLRQRSTGVVLDSERMPIPPTDGVDGFMASAAVFCFLLASRKGVRMAACPSQARLGLRG